MVKDPVCGMEVEPESANPRLVRAGKTYYFCSAKCRDAFDGRLIPKRVPPNPAAARTPRPAASGRASHASPPGRTLPAGTTVLHLMALHCASCALPPENGLKKTNGVRSANGIFATKKATLCHDPKPAPDAL